MGLQWIDAASARQLIAEEFGHNQAEILICKNAHSGMVHARARMLRHQGRDGRDRPIPAAVWRAEGGNVPQLDWATGELSAAIDDGAAVTAFGVQFELGGLLQLLPIARRGDILASLSVVGDADWMTAAEAIKVIEPNTQHRPRDAEGRLIEAARQGFVASRAVEARAADRGFEGWRWEEREWDVPAWFWEQYTRYEFSSRNFRSNTARGRGNGPIAPFMQLDGIHFFKADLLRHFNLMGEHSGASRTSDTECEDDQAKLPRLPDRRLEAWWTSKESVVEALTLNELLTLIRAAFPQHHIARDRIRGLAGGRKRGPKPISDKAPAK